MNKYIIPICDIQAGEVWNEVITATSLQDCKDKIISKFSERYDLDDTVSYNELIKDLDNIDVLIGRIKDIEEL